MLEWVEGALRKSRASSYSGEAKREHGEAQAEGLVARGLKLLEVEQGELVSQPKGTLEKQALAWWVCQHTTVRRRWVSERLEMGDESRVTQAIRRVKSGRDPDLERLRKRLERVLPDER